jgi:hypothetical protein
VTKLMSEWSLPWAFYFWSGKRTASVTGPIINMVTTRKTSYRVIVDTELILKTRHALSN